MLPFKTFAHLRHFAQEAARGAAFSFYQEGFDPCLRTTWIAGNCVQADTVQIHPWGDASFLTSSQTMPCIVAHCIR